MTLGDMFMKLDLSSTFPSGFVRGVIIAYDEGKIRKSDLVNFFLYHKRINDFDADEIDIHEHEKTIKMLISKLYRRPSFTYLVDSFDKNLTPDAFFEAIEYNSKGKDSELLSKDYYYIAHNGRLAKIRRGKTLDKLLRKGIIFDHRAKEELNGVGAQYVKHRRIIDRVCERWNPSITQRLKDLLDGYKDCKMTIDHKFGIAYAPSYNDSESTYEGDACCGYSCMRGRVADAEEFYGKIHGCSVVRFFDGPDDAEHQVGRCLMYEYNGQRHFIRIYGYPKYFYFMLNKIKDQMTDEDIFGRSKEIEGMRLETDWDGSETAMYLDGNEYGISQDGDKFFITTDYDHNCKNVTDDSIDELLGGNVCEHCGECVSDNDAIWIGDEVFCCWECAEDAGYRSCERCGNWENIDEMIFVDGYGYYCCEYCAEKDGHRRCQNCGEWHSGDEMIQAGDDYYCDADCANNDGWNYCEGYSDWTRDAVYYCPDDGADYCREYVEENKTDYELVDCEWVKKQDEPKDETND